MIVRVDDARFTGRTVTLDGVDARTVARAVRRGEATTEDATVAVVARRPHPVHERVGYVHPDVGVRTRTALAAAARARGLSTPVDGEIRDLRERLRDLPVETVETTDERRAAAAASAETERLRERVAERRGELTVRRETDEDADAVAEQFRAAARDLSEAETQAAAARQTLARKRLAARDARDALDRRMGLEDDLANRRREARARLVERVRGAYERAVAAAPGGPGAVSDPFAVDAVTAALAIARVAAMDAPVVLACDRFDGPAAASAWLGTPVVRVR